MLQWLYTYVASVCSECFICFSNVCYKSVYLDVVYVSHKRCKCFMWMLHMFFNGFLSVFSCVLQVFQSHILSVSNACFKCFIYLHTYICCKCFQNRSSVAVGDAPAAAGSEQGKQRGRERSPCGVRRRVPCPNGVGPHVGARNRVQARASVCYPFRFL